MVMTDGKVGGIPSVIFAVDRDVAGRKVKKFVFDLAFNPPFAAVIDFKGVSEFVVLHAVLLHMNIVVN